MSHNVWTNNGQEARQPPQPALEEPTAPHFNSQEVREFLKSGFRSAAPGDGKSLHYKVPGGQANSARVGGAWATNPRNMSSGKDFFFELRKQVSAMQQGGERAGG